MERRLLLEDMRLPLLHAGAGRNIFDRIEVEAKKAGSSSHQISAAIFFSSMHLHHSTSTLTSPMDVQPSSAISTTSLNRSEVDTTRPFRSVKEAVAVFGERFLVGEAFAQRNNVVAPKPIYAVTAAKPLYSACSSPITFSTSSTRVNQSKGDDAVILNSLKKLETELEETKKELMTLKEREIDTEIVVASLHTELYKTMSKMTEIEEATSAAANTGKRRLEIEELWGEEKTGFKYLPSLAQALTLEDMVDNFVGGRRKAKLLKKKPIVPLIGDVFSRKKVSAHLF